MLWCACYCLVQSDTIRLLRCRFANPVPAPTLVDLPTVATKDAALERYEGMLVTINGPLTVTNNFATGVTV